MTATPFDWLEASYFYYRPEDLYGFGKIGRYLDKGFNVKFIYRPKNFKIPNIAVGLDDFAGTGYFTREYLVSTMIFDKSKISLGIGWGKYAGDKSFKNPLSSVSSSFINRPLFSDNYKLGGSPSYDQWFKGEAAIFGGIEHSISKSNALKLKLEYDPYNYFDFSANYRNDASYDIRKKENDINFGLSYSLNNLATIDLSYLKGNTLNFSFNIALTLNDNFSKKPKYNKDINVKKISHESNQTFYEELLLNLNNNNLLLQTANFSNNQLDLAISTAQYRNAIRSSSYAANISKKVAENNNIKLSSISVKHINAGIELNEITYIANHMENNSSTPIEVSIKNTNLEPGEPNSFYKNEFKPSVNFPVIFSSISPSIISHIGNLEKFYFGGLNLQLINEIQFKRNLILSSELNTRLYDNFKDTVAGPDSKMRHVRTDVVQYLKEDDIYIGRMQIDYLMSPYREVYAKFSGGIFEQMYGGIGGEILYRPFYKNFNIGMELFYVKQRAFDQKFSFKDYETTTGHINFGYKFASGIESNLSFGRYLAKDDGYTLDIGRTTTSGFKAGVYFTRTNVSANLFGEGSFDKGFYFQIPLDFFSNEYSGNYSSFKLSPLTRDGGAKLIHDKDLKGLIYNSTYHELSSQWEGFLN